MDLRRARALIVAPLVIGALASLTVLAPATSAPVLSPDDAVRCVGNGERRAVRVPIRTRPDVVVTRLRIFVDGGLQADVARRDLPRMLRHGAVYLQTRTRDGKPFMVAGRHLGSIELATSSRPRAGGRAVAGRTRLSIPFHVCL